MRSRRCGRRRRRRRSLSMMMMMEQMELNGCEFMVLVSSLEGALSVTEGMGGVFLRLLAHPPDDHQAGREDDQGEEETGDEHRDRRAWRQSVGWTGGSSRFLSRLLRPLPIIPVLQSSSLRIVLVFFVLGVYFVSGCWSRILAGIPRVRPFWHCSSGDRRRTISGLDRRLLESSWGEGADDEILADQHTFPEAAAQAAESIFGIVPSGEAIAGKDEADESG